MNMYCSKRTIVIWNARFNNSIVWHVKDKQRSVILFSIYQVKVFVANLFYINNN